MKQTRHPLNRIALAAALAVGFATTPATAQDVPSQQERNEARIPFADHGGIRDWQPGANDRTLYIQSRNRDWYRATLMGKAIDLPFTWAIGFDTGPMGTFDRFSTVVVDGWRYPVQSLVRIEGEPPRRGSAEQA